MKKFIQNNYDNNRSALGTDPELNLWGPNLTSAQPPMESRGKNHWSVGQRDEVHLKLTTFSYFKKLISFFLNRIHLENLDYMMIAGARLCQHLIRVWGTVTIFTYSYSRHRLYQGRHFSFFHRERNPQISRFLGFFIFPAKLLDLPPKISNDVVSH